MNKYAVLIERTGTGYSAHVPDLPGCVAAAETYDETVQLIQEGIHLHLEDMRERGDRIPEPVTLVETVEA